TVISINKKRKEKKMATETKKEPVTKSEGDFKKVDLSLSKFAEPPDVSKVVREAQPTIEVVGKIIKVLKKIFIWVGLIVLIIFLATNKPLQEKTLSVFDNVRKGSVSGGVEATLKWWKDPSVYGANPELRSGGPFSAKIIIRNDSVLKFDMYYEARDGSRQKSSFKGEKNSFGRFEGTWSQRYPEDGGDWYLKQDSNNPRLFVGKYSDKSGEWINFSLRIDPE
ncbi:MAG: hypothetical protein AAB688_02310, partial [Patescibacteria group bacterium]